MRALQKTETWQVIDLPPEEKLIGCNFTIKHKADGTIERHKTRLVAKCFTQTYGIDYQENFASSAKMNCIRVSCLLQPI